MFLVLLLLHVFIAFIDPAIDRRIAYKDFRSNPYLHFDAGLVHRALGVQLGEFYFLVGLITVFHLMCFRSSIVLLLLLIDCHIDILLLLVVISMLLWLAH